MVNFRKVIISPFIFAFSVLLFLSGCSDPEFEKASISIKTAEVDLISLASSLDSSSQSAIVTLPNLKYLKQYANVVRKISPDMSAIIATLEAEGTVAGGSYTFLSQRLEKAQQTFETSGKKSRDAAIFVSQEATAISVAAKPDVFNDSLVDVINVLADMSGGKLPKLKFGETADKTMPPTQHLVGNSRYGSWNNSSGSSLWVWYGQYRLFSDVLGWRSGYRYNQNDWYRNRSASYHGDVGRHYYGTQQNNKTWASAARKQPSVNTNKASPSAVKSFKSTNRLSNYAPRTSRAPKAMASAYTAKNKSSYSNTRSSPSRKSGFGGRSGGK